MTFLFILIAVLGFFYLRFLIKQKPEWFSSKALLQSANTLGALALLMILTLSSAIYLLKNPENNAATTISITDTDSDVFETL